MYLLWGEEMPELWGELDREFLQELRRRWTDNQQRTKRSSFSHLEVSQVKIERQGQASVRSSDGLRGDGRSTFGWSQGFSGAPLPVLISRALSAARVGRSSGLAP